MQNELVYLDYPASTPVDPRVIKEILVCFDDNFGNPSSTIHLSGRMAAQAIEKARRQVAACIEAKEEDIFFTSGATESNNLVILGVAARLSSKNHIITCVTEHKSVLEPCKHLQRTGKWNITYLKVNRHGEIDLNELSESITDKTFLCSLMLVNNEIGTIQNIKKIGKILQKKEVLFHCDATQGIGKIPINVNDFHVDFLSLSGHKIYGPKGVGALYIRSGEKGLPISSIVYGGGHQQGIRPGTLNTPGIVGLGKACDLMQKELIDNVNYLQSIHEYMYKKLFECLDDVYLISSSRNCVPGILNIAIKDVEAETLLSRLTKLALSTGSACNVVEHKPSHVIASLGINKELYYSCIRIGLGRFTTKENIDFAVEEIKREVNFLRQI